MGLPLRVLLTHDSCDDALHVLRELRRADFQLFSKTVASVESLVQTLRNHCWDVVLVKDSLKGCTGLEALRIVRQYRPDLPVIMLARGADSKMAAAAMQAGAADFVTFRELYRLSPAVEREIRHADLQREHAQAEEQFYRCNTQLKERASQLERLAAELVEAEQRERQRLAQVLHDHLQQVLYAARIAVSQLRRRAEQDTLRESLEKLDGMLEESIEASRELTVDLSPPVFHEKGLLAGLKWLRERVRVQHGLHVEVKAAAKVEPASKEVGVMLFQSVRELLFNVVKHAGTDRARVEIQRSAGGQMRIVVSDQGAGFQPRKDMARCANAGGFGLSTLGQRLEAIGGRMEIRAAPGKGSRIILLAPAERKAGVAAP